MWKLILITLYLTQSLSVHAKDDDDIFAEFEEIPLEVDKDFPDDFTAIESAPGLDYNQGLLIADTYEPYSSHGFMRREKSISVLGGNETIASVYYFTIFPQARFEFWKIYGHLGVPLRFPIYDNGRRAPGFARGWALVTPRPQDFRSFWDAQRIIRHFEIGKVNDPHFLRLSRNHTVSLGQGELLKNMSPEGLYDADTLFLSGHTEWDNFRIDGLVLPIAKAEMLGLSLRFMPFTNLGSVDFVRGINFDVSYINDFTAPNHAQTAEGSFVLDDEQRFVKRESGMAQGMVLGVASLYQPWSWLSLKPYVSSGHLWLSGLQNGEGDLPLSYGGGLHLGHDATFSFLPGTKRSNLVFKAEGRLFSSGYFPAYFGSTYLSDRLIFSSQPLTKSQVVSKPDDPRFRFGYLLELGYVYEDLLSALLSYENAHSFAHATSLPPLRKMQFLTSLNFDIVKFYLGYQATQIAQMKELFDFDKSRALLSVRGQLKVLSFLYFDAWAKHSFGINDMITSGGGNEDKSLWLSHLAETRSLNFGLGLELSMTF